MLNLALLISGGGTSAAAIINAAKKDLKINPVLLIASKKGISGIARIISLGFPKKNIHVVDPKNYSDSISFSGKLLYLCSRYKVDLIGQYGWLPKTPEKLIQKYKNRIINQHPGPLDRSGIDFGGKGMYGRRVHAAVLYFRRETNHDFWTEATTHFVTEQFDKGKVIKSKKIKILRTDAVEDLQKRTLPVEHQVQVAALKDFANNRIRIVRRKIPLIKKSEIGLLNQAKKAAIYLYPNG